MLIAKPNPDALLQLLEKPLLLLGYRGQLRNRRSFDGRSLDGSRLDGRSL
jgi:hypothetical protein